MCGGSVWNLASTKEYFKRSVTYYDDGSFLPKILLALVTKVDPFMSCTLTWYLNWDRFVLLAQMALASRVQKFRLMHIMGLKRSI